MCVLRSAAVAKPSGGAVSFVKLPPVDGVMPLCVLRLGFATAALPPLTGYGAASFKTSESSRAGADCSAGWDSSAGCPGCCRPCRFFR